MQGRCVKLHGYLNSWERHSQKFCAEKKQEAITWTGYHPKQSECIEGEQFRVNYLVCTLLAFYQSSYDLWVFPDRFRHITTLAMELECDVHGRHIYTWKNPAHSNCPSAHDLVMQMRKAHWLVDHITWHQLTNQLCALTSKVHVHLARVLTWPGMFIIMYVIVLNNGNRTHDHNWKLMAITLAKLRLLTGLLNFRITCNSGNRVGQWVTRLHEIWAGWFHPVAVPM